jgi:hypothetical protein
MSSTPRTDEAIERWHQGKVNILEEIAKLEIDLNLAEAERVELAKQLQSEKEMYAACQNECEEQARLLGMSGEREAALLTKTGYWESLINWLEQVQEAYKGRDRDDLTQLYARGPFAGWSQEKMVRLADELWENEQKYPLRGDRK